jgi:hypothetical protein
MPQLYPQIQTTDASPAIIPISINVPEDTTAVLRGTVAASDHNGGDATWEMDIAVRRIGLAAPQSLGVPIKKNSPSAAAWQVSVGFDVDGNLQVTVTGELTKTIQWVYIHEDLFGMVGRVLNSASRVAP